MTLPPNHPGIGPALERFTDDGGAIIHSSSRGHEEHIAINPLGQAELYAQRYPHFPSLAERVTGLSMVGLVRHEGRRPHFRDASYREVQEGDRIIFEKDDGRRIKSGKVHKVQPAVGVLATAAYNEGVKNIPPKVRRYGWAKHVFSQVAQVAATQPALGVEFQSRRGHRRGGEARRHSRGESRHHKPGITKSRQ